LNPGAQSSIFIREANAMDCETIAQLLYDSFLEIKSVYTPGGFTATVLDPEKVKARLHEGPVWIAVAGQTIVGTVSAIIKPTGLYMRGMAVDPASRGQRVGKLLLETVESYANQNQCTRIYLSTAPYLLNAITLYEKSGFIRNDDPPFELFGTPLFTMEKKLNLERAILRIAIDN
jgi:N-acetylglutamate synthase-like GNAT family acetyltransferase